jgi:putative DNA primase/helicase|nr:MAG TPA: dsDNA helicase [Caudoviricetes sp.]
MFKGYIPTRGKRPTESVKGRSQFYTMNEVKDLNEYGGVLDDNFIMVDVDDRVQSIILKQILDDLEIKYHSLKTTRGMHFYFLNTNVTSNAIAVTTAVGITVDIKIGTKNAVVPLKLDGVERELTISDEVDPLPKFLTVVKRLPDFFNMEEGEGRNQTFFTYILKLQGHGFIKDEIRECIRLINDYILKDPLSKSEIDTILRDDAFNKPSFFNEKGQFLFDKFAEFVRTEEHIIKINNKLHIYVDGVYSDKYADIEKALIKHIPTLTKSRRAEVISYLELIAKHENLSDTNYIVCNNGLLNLDTLELEEFTPNYISKNKIAVSYNPNAQSDVLDHTLDKIACFRPKLRGIIEEMVGYCLLRRNELGKSFILTGVGSNGKSTILDVLKTLIGENNISSLGMNELGVRFKTAELYGKMVNIGDDISSAYIDDNSIFKKLVTGESVNVERKGADPFDFKNTSKLIFSANEVPRINDTSNGLMRRLVIIPFNAEFKSTDEDFDPFIKDKLLTTESLQHLLNLGLQGLKRVLKRNDFETVEEVTAELREYEKENNPILEFLEDNKVENEAVVDIYRRYAVWCQEGNLKALGRTAFSRNVKKQGYDIKVLRIDGKNTRVFAKKV